MCVNACVWCMHTWVLRAWESAHVGVYTFSMYTDVYACLSLHACLCVCMCVYRPDPWSLGVKPWQNLLLSRCVSSYEELLYCPGEFLVWRFPVSLSLSSGSIDPFPVLSMVWASAFTLPNPSSTFWENLA